MSAGVVLLRLPLLAALAALALALLASGLRTASAQDTVTVSGRVVNGTAAAGLPPELPVTLHSFDLDAGSVLTARTTADDLARFLFEGVVPRAGWRYTVSIDYAEVFYSTDLAPDDLSEPVELMVYETTPDVAVVGVEQQVLVIADVDEKNREIEAVEFVRLFNGSDRTLLPDLSSVDRISFLRFPLPPQTTQLNVQSDLPGGGIVAIDTGFAITAPVVPGEHRIDFSYRFPYKGDAISYRQSFLQGVQRYQVLVPERLSQVRVAQLLPLPPVEPAGSGTVYRVWELTDFSPGQGLTLELTRLPQPSLLARLEKSVTNGTLWKVGIPGIVGATLAFLLLYSALGRPRGVPAPTEPVAPHQRDGGVDREALVRAVAALDERFEQGRMLEAEYQAGRERLKAHILGVSGPGERDQDEEG